ncbi:MAG: hypothetical protein QW215_07735, partial [Ignisphaera sp.]
FPPSTLTKYIRVYIEANKFIVSKISNKPLQTYECGMFMEINKYPRGILIVSVVLWTIRKI